MPWNSDRSREMNPEGEYGIKVWDHGTYELEKWTADRIAFTLHGSRVSGRFSLVRFKESEPLSWFLMKRREIWFGEWPLGSFVVRGRANCRSFRSESGFPKRDI
jgi:hypothetical protein